MFTEDSDADDEGSAFNRASTVGDACNFSRKRRNADVVHSSEDGGKSFSDLGVELIHGRNTFVPLYLISEYKDRETGKICAAVAVRMPSGISENGLVVEVTDEGQVLEISLIWPKALTDVDLLHKKWRK